jgi:CcmD family protein
MNKLTTVLSVLLPVLLLAAFAAHGLAQDAQTLPQSTLPSQSLRPYWHVFIAYSIAIVLVLGWVISIGRRLRDVEERLGRS